MANNILLAISALLMVSLLCSCELRQERRLSRALEGSWELNKVVLVDWNGAGQDSIIENASMGTLNVEFCDDPRGIACELDLELSGGRVQLYTYQLQAIEDFQSINLEQSNFDRDNIVFPYNWTGSFKINEISDSNLELAGIQGGDGKGLASSEVLIFFSK